MHHIRLLPAHVHIIHNPNDTPHHFHVFDMHDDHDLDLDAIIHSSNFCTLATYSYTTTLPTDATYTVTSTATASGITCFTT